MASNPYGPLMRQFADMLLLDDPENLWDTLGYPIDTNSVIAFYKANLDRIIGVAAEHELIIQPEMEKDAYLLFGICGAVFEAGHAAKQRVDESSSTRKDLISYIQNKIDTLEHLQEDEALVHLIDADVNKLVRSHQYLSEILDTIRSRRGTDTRPIAGYLRTVKQLLGERGFNTTAMANLIYDLLINFGAPDFVGPSPSSKREQIRKWFERLE